VDADFRLRSLGRFSLKEMMPWFATKMPDLDFQNIYYYIKRPRTRSMRGTSSRLVKTPTRSSGSRGREKVSGRRYCAVRVRGRLPPQSRDLERLGVLFTDMDTAVREYPRSCVGIRQDHPPNDNKFAALNSAVWSGGSFIYVPPGVKVDMPLQAYFRINAENMASSSGP